MRSDGIDTKLRLGSLCLLLLAAGCSGGAAPDSGAAADPDAGDLDRLLSLPYVGSSPKGGDERAGTVFHDGERSSPGPTLVTIQMLSRAELLDESGTVLRSWHLPGSGRWERAELLDGGDLLAIGADPPPQGTRGIPDAARYVARFEWDGRLRWKRAMTAHHDAERTPDGRLALLGFERGRLPEIHPEIDVRDDWVGIVDEQGNVVERRSLLEAFAAAPTVLPLQPVAPNRHGVVPWLDLFHVNSLEWMRFEHLVGRHPIFDPGHVLLCSRHQNAIFVLDWEKNEPVWAWGRGELVGPHDARVLRNGHLLVFDNGVGKDRSRILEVDPTSGEIVWQYTASPPESFYTLSKGSSQRLPNGNTLIADSDNGRAFEVTVDGDVVWDWFCPHEIAPGRRAAIVRAIRHDPANLPPLD
jgi:hypothetical protein